MKKIITAVMIICCVSTSSMAAFISGKVNEITVNTIGTYVKIGTYGKYLDPSISADNKKAILALLMTAQSQGADVQIDNIGCSTSNVWCKVKLIPVP